MKTYLEIIRSHRVITKNIEKRNSFMRDIKNKHLLADDSKNKL